MKTFAIYLFGGIPLLKMMAEDFDDCARKWAMKQGHTNCERSSLDCTIGIKHKNEWHYYVCWH